MNDSKVLYLIGGQKRFVGEFRNGQPWNGTVRNYNFSREKIKEFTGEIREGKPFIGTGIRFKRNEFGADLFEIIQHENWEPDDSMIEHQETYNQELLNEHTRKEYSEWEDYIIVDWKEGEPLEREDIEQNLRVYYHENYRRKDK
ncbi:hypothetical protein [Shouchella patagoniensis]|uniref:hypothetical protein n=1 Tax=Shouchella patagoniensis TaxID=228576 RepID=UPI000995BBDE|nr:hypothetical protein [Shouchella patagoniensis]